MKIVSSKNCPYVQRVVALLEAKRVFYEIEYIEERFASFYLRESTYLGQLVSNRTGRARTGPPDCCVGETGCGCQCQCGWGVRKPASGSADGLA